jgi:hypothetical protein
MLNRGLLLSLLLSVAAGAEPVKPSEASKPLNLPVIEVRSATPTDVGPRPSNNTIELPPVTGSRPGKMSVEGRRYLLPGGLGMPSGTAGGVPQAGAPGTPGGLFQPGAPRFR